jgi:hypothetical protein
LHSATTWPSIDHVCRTGVAVTVAVTGPAEAVSDTAAQLSMAR